MVRRTLKIVKGCQVVTTNGKSKITFKCKNLKRKPSAKEIIDSIDTRIKVR